MEYSDALSSAWYDALRRKPYMPGWIKDAADAMQVESRRRELAEKANQAAKASLVANAPALFQILHAKVKEDVEEFNQIFPEAMKRLVIEAIGAKCFRVERKYPPEFFLTAKLADNQIVITWEIVQNELKYSGIFEMEHNASGCILTEHRNALTFENASRRLLEPALKGLV